MVEMADVDGDGVNLDAMRKRLRFRHTVSEVSRNTASELSEDDRKYLMEKKHSQIVGGRKMSIQSISFMNSKYWPAQSWLVTFGLVCLYGEPQM